MLFKKIFRIQNALNVPKCFHSHKLFKEPVSRPTVNTHGSETFFVFLGVFCLIEPFKLGLRSNV